MSEALIIDTSREHWVYPNEIFGRPLHHARLWLLELHSAKIATDPLFEKAAHLS